MQPVGRAAHKLEEKTRACTSQGIAVRQEFSDKHPKLPFYAGEKSVQAGKTEAATNISSKPKAHAEYTDIARKSPVAEEVSLLQTESV